jgi:NADH-quinone oxidoreductase subunit E
MALSEHVVEEIRALAPQFPSVRTAVMPALDLAQEELGYLTQEAMSEVASALNLDPGYVEGVATFYTLFHTQPVGKHRMYLCTNISCKLRGADELLEHAMRQVGVRDQSEVSADGLFSVEPVECLGACEYAPVMRLDHAYHHDLTAEKLDTLIAERRDGLRPPARGGGRRAAPGGSLPSLTSEESGPHPAAAPPTSPQGGEVTKKPRAPRKKKATDAS